jgi:hypothetical protein
LLELFKNLSDQEKLTLHQSLGKLLQGTDELAERINREKEQCNE